MRDMQDELQNAFAQVEQHVASVYEPAGQLVIAVVKASQDVRNKLATVFNYSTTDSPSESSIYLFFEFLYFFFHMTLRAALQAKYSESQMQKLRAFMEPFVAWVGVNAFFSHWPDKYKDAMRSDIYDKLNDAEQEYGSCRALLNKNDHFDSSSLMGRLTCNAVALFEREGDRPAMTAVLIASTNALAEMQLSDHVSCVKQITDHIDPEVISKFWK